jgi:tetratricopeptide (TPR) repeat protein
MKLVLKLVYCLLVILSVSSAIAAEPAWWTQQKRDCGLSPSLDYETWKRMGSPCTRGPSGPSAAEIAAQQAAAAQRQREAAAQQRRDAEATAQNNRGLDAWKEQDWATAADCFEKAVQNAPDNQTYKDNLAAANQKLKEQRDHEIAVHNMQQSIQNWAQTLSAAPSSGEMDFMSAEPARPTLEFGDPNIVEPVLIKASIQSLSKIQAEIQGVQEALKRLTRSTSIDANERKEWEKRSADALRDSYALGADTTANVLTAYTQRQIDAAKKELWRANDMLASETDPNRREQLHTAFSALNDRKVELEQAKDAVEKAHDAVDILKKAQDITYSKDQEDSESLIEKAWNVCDKLKILPGWASPAKIIVDASYDIMVQAFSAQRINALDANSEQYLKALDVLSNRMKTLVKLKKAQA